MVSAPPEGQWELQQHHKTLLSSHTILSARPSLREICSSQHEPYQIKGIQGQLNFQAMGLRPPATQECSVNLTNFSEALNTTLITSESSRSAKVLVRIANSPLSCNEFHCRSVTPRTHTRTHTQTWIVECKRSPIREFVTWGHSAEQSTILSVAQLLVMRRLFFITAAKQKIKPAKAVFKKCFCHWSEIGLE